MSVRGKQLLVVITDYCILVVVTEWLGLIGGSVEAQ